MAQARAILSQPGAGRPLRPLRSAVRLAPAAGTSQGFLGMPLLPPATQARSDKRMSHRNRTAVRELVPSAWMVTLATYE